MSPPRYFYKKAAWLLDRLYRLYPQRQYLATIVPAPSGDHAVLEVRKLPDRDARTVVMRQVQRANGARPEFLFSSENLLGLFSAQDFDDKLICLRKLCDPSRDPWIQAQEAIADAILLDFTEEQLAMRGSSARFSKKEFALALNRTTEFCASDFRTDGAMVETETSLAKVLIRVVAGLKFLTAGQLSPWSHRVRLLGGTGDVELNLYIENLLDSFLDLNFGPDRIFLTGENRKRARAQVETHEAKLAERREMVYRQSETSHAKLSSKVATVEALVRWELRDFLTSGVAFDSGAGSWRKRLIWTSEQMQRHQAREEEYALRQQRLLHLYRKS